jgi:CelD/BcsL family acetyltransferase involved in cellulose biosynthesis
MLRHPTSPEVAPFAELSQFSDYPSYLNSLSHKFRQGLRNRKRRLEKSGDVRFEMIAGGDAARAALADAIDLKRKWLVQRGAMSTAFVDTETKACLLDLAADPATGAVVARLTIDGVPAAIRFGFEYRTTHFTYMGAFNDEFANLSPGRLLLEFVLSGFKERGLTRLDMLPPGAHDKAEWCSAAVGVADYTLPLTHAGRLYAELYQERIRPRLRWTWQHMPASLRSLIAALLLRL